MAARARPPCTQGAQTWCAPSPSRDGRQPWLPPLPPPASTPLPPPVTAVEALAVATTLPPSVHLVAGHNVHEEEDAMPSSTATNPPPASVPTGHPSLDQSIQAVHHLYHHRLACTPTSSPLDAANRHRPSCPRSTARAARCPTPLAASSSPSACCPHRPSMATIAWPESAAKHNPLGQVGNMHFVINKNSIYRKFFILSLWIDPVLPLFYTILRIVLRFNASRRSKATRSSDIIRASTSFWRRCRGQATTPSLQNSEYGVLPDPYPQPIGESSVEKFRQDSEDENTDQFQVKSHDEGLDIHEDPSKYQPKAPFPSVLEAKPISNQKLTQNEEMLIERTPKLQYVRRR
ncbi:hypothetical protein ACLOJK_008165 [Asimina triloba]